MKIHSGPFFFLRQSGISSILNLKPALTACIGLSQTWLLSLKVKTTTWKLGGYRFRHGKNHTPDDDHTPDEEPPYREEPFIFNARHTTLPTTAEKIFIVQPDFRYGKERFLPVKYRLNEAKALIQSVADWQLEGVTVQTIRDQSSNLIFTTGKIENVGKIISEVKKADDVSAVFLNIGRINNRQTRALEDAWKCRVFDRYRVVLEIFKRRAFNMEAKVQVMQAELQYLRHHLSEDNQHHDRQRGGANYISGSGETAREIDKRILSQKEGQIKKSIKKLKERREVIRTKRKIKNFPQVALIGYTNAGKTTLTKFLSRDDKMVPDDKLFATLDTSAHRGRLPSGLTTLFLDTIGFISDLPHELVESFSATLADVKNADLLLHVRDMSHPERKHQKETVIRVLERLNFDQSLFDEMIEVHNKIDLRTEGDIDEEDRTHLVHLVSATEGTGIDQLRQSIETKVIKATGREVKRFLIPLDGEHLQWLYHNGVVVKTEAGEDGKLYVDAMLDQAMLSKWTKTFEIEAVYRS